MAERRDQDEIACVNRNGATVRGMQRKRSEWVCFDVVSDRFRRHRDLPSAAKAILAVAFRTCPIRLYALLHTAEVGQGSVHVVRLRTALQHGLFTTVERDRPVWHAT